jgi:lysozyme family protein
VRSANTWAVNRLIKSRCSSLRLNVANLFRHKTEETMPQQADAFTEAFLKLLGVEGGYSDNPADSGGKTKFGITEATLRASKYAGTYISEMDIDTAARIYKEQYWDVMRLDEVSQLSRRIAYELFDTGVNMGPGTAARFLQRSLNVLNKQQTLWLDLPVTGVVDKSTIDTLAIFLKQRGAKGEEVLLKMLNCLQGARYIEIAEQRQKDEAFVFGWFNQRVEV